MTTRRAFLGQAAGLGFSACAGTLMPRFAAAQTAGGGVTSWAGASHTDLLSRVWASRFTNLLPWVLDPIGTAPGGYVIKPDAPGTNSYSVRAGQTTLPVLAPNLPPTTVWGYEATANGVGVASPGRTFVVQRGVPITVNWSNNLVDANNVPLPHLLGVDQTFSMQTDASGAKINGVPIAVHHHGGGSAPEFDGAPDQWITPQKKQVGAGVSASNSNASQLTYTYNNDEEASVHWYHDHADAITRINAYAGLAGLYVVRDANEAALVSRNLLPTGKQEVPLVIQDKIFQADGNLAYVADIPAFNGWNLLSDPPPVWSSGAPTKKLSTFYPIPVDSVTGLPVVDPATGNPTINVSTGQYASAGAVGAYNPDDPASVVAGSGPTHVPEMYGDVIVVNGVAWPTLKVEPRQYRLRLLNASDSRVYNLRFVTPAGVALTFFQIGTDQGLLNQGVRLTSVVIAPGERQDVIVDFTRLKPGTKIVVINDAAFPYPFGTPTNAAVDPWGTVMQIDVSLPLDVSVNKATVFNENTILRGRAPGTPILPEAQLPQNVVVRRILLGEGCDEYGRVMPLLGTVFGSTGKVTDADAGTKAFHDAPDIFPKVGATEIWEFWNTTEDAHPIHMHLVRFRVARRQQFTGTVVAKPMANGWTGVRFAAPPVLVPLTNVNAPKNEQGWKDTVVCLPGEVTRVYATFNKAGTYVYHCHILGHEEHDMMRWFKVA